MEKIKQLRKENNITMKRLGEIIGVSEAAVSQYENGKRQPDQTTLVKIADFFDVSIDYILGRTDFSMEENHIICENISKLIETQKNPPNPNNVMGIDLTFGAIQKFDYQFTRESLSQFASYFGVSVDYLLRRTETTPTPSLSIYEQQLINNFRLLNEEGQEKLLDHSIDLVSSGRYIKSSEHKMVSKEA